MQIRQARVSDIESIKSLADSLAVSLGDSSRTSGFYNYSLTPRQYLNRISSPFFFIAENPGGLEGFCMAFNSQFVRRLMTQESQLERDAIFNYLGSLGVDYIYIDQFAVKKPRTPLGSLTAVALRERIIAETRKHKVPCILGAIVHQPWKNIDAIRFVKRSGFNLNREVNSSGILLGLYQLNV